MLRIIITAAQEPVSTVYNVGDMAVGWETTSACRPPRLLILCRRSIVTEIYSRWLRV